MRSTTSSVSVENAGERPTRANPSSTPMPRPTVSLLLLVLVLCTGCLSRGGPFDATVRVIGRNGEELGVATPHGVVFLGHVVDDASVELVPAFGDGPSLERADSALVADGLRLAIPSIDLPNVRLSFDALKPGTDVVVRGRKGRDAWETDAEVARVPNASGLLLKNDGGIRNRLERGMVGAGVYHRGSDGEWRLVGLVDGLVTVGERTYLGVAGAGHLWKAAAHERSLDRRRWVYREDVL